MRCARAKHARAHTRSRTCRLTDGERGEEGREGGEEQSSVRPSVSQSVRSFVCRSVDGERFLSSSLSSSHLRGAGAGAGAGRGRIKKQKTVSACAYTDTHLIFFLATFFS